MLFVLLYTVYVQLLPSTDKEASNSAWFFSLLHGRVASRIVHLSKLRQDEYCVPVYRDSESEEVQHLLFRPLALRYL